MALVSRMIGLTVISVMVLTVSNGTDFDAFGVCAAIEPKKLLSPKKKCTNSTTFLLSGIHYNFSGSGHKFQISTDPGPQLITIICLDAVVYVYYFPF